jgi:organic radical activating enzyme
MTRRMLPFLEMMSTNVCNLSCAGCTTFSDLDHRGYMTWAQARQQIEPWLERLDIQAFGFMGGEPLINPDLRAWLVGIRELMPNTQIRFITNGLLLERHWWVVDLLDQLGNSVLKISKHVNDPRIDSAISQVFASRKWVAIKEFGIDRWHSPSGMRFQIASPTRFLKTFQGDYHDMRPHDNNIHDAFDVCVQQRCPLLHDSRLYKCGTAGLTPKIVQRHGMPNSALWQPYLTKGLDSDCSDRELDKFINNFGKPHAICRQCPSSKDHMSMLDHTKTVKFK